MGAVAVGEGGPGPVAVRASELLSAVLHCSLSSSYLAVVRVQGVTPLASSGGAGGGPGGAAHQLGVGWVQGRGSQLSLVESSVVNYSSSWF